MKIRTLALDNISIPADWLCFDIETTGLSSRNSQIYLIGAIYMQDSQVIFTQWFAESMSDEKELLSHFDELCSRYQKLITYNGETFDIPFVRSAMRQYAMQSHMDDMESIDIYAHIRRLRSLFSTTDMTLKSMEKFLGIYREDKFSGGDLIAVYKEYLGSHDERLMHFLLLHNEEDVRSLPMLAELMNYEAVLGGNFEGGSVFTTSASMITFSAHAACSLPTPIIYSDQGFTVELKDDTISVVSPTVTGTMKHFFKDYKNYFYLPMEDTAIHKSVGIFTDKSVRQKATPATAYIKKDGTFIPVSRGLAADEKWSELPYFYHEYKEKSPYILLDADVLKNPLFVCDYIRYVIVSLGLCRDTHSSR